MNIDTLNYQHKGTVKITSYEQCKNPDGSIDDSASWICFRVLELNDILYKDFIKVLSGNPRDVSKEDFIRLYREAM